VKKIGSSSVICIYIFFSDPYAVTEVTVHADFFVKIDPLYGTGSGSPVTTIAPIMPMRVLVTKR